MTEGSERTETPHELTPEESTELSDELGTVLRVGVLIAALLLSAGLLWGLTILGPSELTSTFSLRSWPSLDAWGPPGVLIALGLVALVATPVSRVIVSLATFARARENDYVLLMLVVLLLLGASIVVGLLA